MLSHDLSDLAEALAQAGHNGGLSAGRSFHVAAILTGLAEDARRLEAAAVPLRVRVVPEDAPNVIRFDTAGSRQSRRNLLACALWPAAVMVPAALAVLVGVGI